MPLPQRRAPRETKERASEQSRARTSSRKRSSSNRIPGAGATDEHDVSLPESPTEPGGEVDAGTTSPAREAWGDTAVRRDPGAEQATLSSASTLSPPCGVILRSGGQGAAFEPEIEKMDVTVVVELGGWP